MIDFYRRFQQLLAASLTKVMFRRSRSRSRRSRLWGPQAGWECKSGANFWSTRISVSNWMGLGITAGVSKANSPFLGGSIGTLKAQQKNVAGAWSILPLLLGKGCFFTGALSSNVVCWTSQDGISTMLPSDPNQLHLPYIMASLKNLNVITSHPVSSAKVLWWRVEEKVFSHLNDSWPIGFNHLVTNNSSLLPFSSCFL